MNILLIGTNRGGHRSLIEMGHRVTLLASSSASESGDLRRGYANVLFLGEDAGPDAFERVAAALHCARAFDAVHSFHDSWQVTAAAIAASLGVACRLNPAATMATLNKDRTRLLAAEAGLSRVRWSKVEQADMLERIGSSLGYPFIVKPLAGTGSLGVNLVRTEQELAALQDLSYPLLLEHVVAGQEYSIEAFSEQGRHRVIAITEKFKAEGSFVEIGHLVPARLSEEQFQQMCAYAARLLDAIGMQDGPSHTEVMWHDGAIELIETHTRTGGDEIPMLVKHACGIDLYALEARQVAGEAVWQDIAGPIVFARHAAVWFAAPALDKPSRLTGIEGVEQARSAPDVVSVGLEKQLGELLRPLRHSFDRSAHAIAMHPDAERALQAALQAAQSLRHQFEPAAQD